MAKNSKVVGFTTRGSLILLTLCAQGVRSDGGDPPFSTLVGDIFGQPEERVGGDQNTGSSTLSHLICRTANLVLNRKKKRIVNIGC
ncbi:hypothetical protein L484_021579 [Morus notabilis]|uniref:Secreted protein n=1 Tax=Morus notabilis TaxID=981085 RepID=W9S5V3_9ROSA|nr:hypothetical protein L484_021579 [Morus notabilis]